MVSAVGSSIPLKAAARRRGDKQELMSGPPPDEGGGIAEDHDTVVGCLKWWGLPNTPVAYQKAAAWVRTLRTNSYYATALMIPFVFRGISGNDSIVWHNGLYNPRRIE